VRRAGILAVVVLGAIGVGTALAAQGDPQQKHNKADMSRARAASLRLSDFPAGWKASPASKTNNSNPRCSIYNPDQSDLVETGKYDAPDFGRPDSSFVSSSTGVFQTAAMAKTGYARVAVPQLSACFGEIFVKAIKAPNSATVISSGPIAFKKVGDRSNAYRLVVSVKTQQGTVPVTTDISLFNKGRTDVAIIFFGIVEPFPPAWEQMLTARVASRVR